MALQRSPFDPKLFWPFILASVCVGLSGNALYEFVKSFFVENSTAPLISGLTCVTGIAVVWVLAQVISRELRREIVSPHTGPAPHKKGLIVLCSNEEVVRKAISYHGVGLQFVWLIVSSKSKPVADRLKEESGGSPNIEIRTVENEAGCREIATVVRQILENTPEGLSVEDIIVDFTGLTKPATVGAVLSALQLGALLQYTGSIELPGGGKSPLDPEQIQLSYVVTSVGSEGTDQSQSASA